MGVLAALVLILIPAALWVNHVVTTPDPQQNDPLPIAEINLGTNLKIGENSLLYYILWAQIWNNSEEN